MSDNRPGDDARRGPTIDDTVDTSSIIPGDEQLLAATTAGGSRPVCQPDRGCLAGAWRSPLFIVSTALILIMVLMAAFPQLFTRQDPGSAISPTRERSGARSLVRVRHSGLRLLLERRVRRPSAIVIGITVTAISAIIAIVLGSLSGYYGGTIDTIFLGSTTILRHPVHSRCHRAVQHIPGAQHLDRVRCPDRLRLDGAVTADAFFTVSARDMDYVNAARALGAPDGVIRRHILPNAITPSSSTRP